MPASADTAPADCPNARRPYHVVMTAASGLYQEWQSRIAYYHYQKQKRLHPCSDMGGFTRLLNTHSAMPDALMEEIPTLLVHQLKSGHCDECDHGFIVMNRPWGAVQFVESAYFRAIPEEYIFIMETDHMFLQAPPNAATPTVPVGFGFYYMISTDPKLESHVRRYLEASIGIREVDNTGPSPVLAHKDTWTKLARPWWDMSLKLKRDPDANSAFGWVLEMWAYVLAARNLGIRHNVSQQIQVEPQGSGTDMLDDKWIFHYTFGQRAGRWAFDKRTHFGRYPPDHLEAPPKCTARSIPLIRNMLTEAAQGIEGWKNKVPPRPDADAGTSPLDKYMAFPRETGLLGSRLRGTGPWKWGKLEELFLYSRGVAYARLDPLDKQQGVIGRWTVVSDNEVRLEVCSYRFRLEFESADAPWTFKASVYGAALVKLADGQLTSTLQQSAEMLPLTPGIGVAALGDGKEGGEGSIKLVEELAGSGPWVWAGFPGLGFMRGGELVTPWGTGVWGATRASGSVQAPHDALFADFASNEHTIRVLDRECGVLLSKRARDGETVRINLLELDTEESSKSKQCSRFEESVTRKG